MNEEQHTARSTEPTRVQSGVKRQDILAAIGRRSEASLIVLTAGTGFGKSLTMHQIRREVSEPHGDSLWLDGKTGLLSFGSRSRCSLPGKSGVAAAYDLRHLAEIIGSQRPGRGRIDLFIDDYDSIVDERLVAYLGHLIRARPAPVRLFIASRNTVPLVEIAALHEVPTLELLQIDLAFSYREARQLASKDSSASGRGSGNLIEMAEGWPSVLRLVLSCAGDARQLAEEYIDTKILQGMEERELEVLKVLSVCRAFNSDLARYLTCDANLDVRLEGLRRKGVPISSPEMNDGTVWYRLHPLVADLLQRRLGKQLLRSVHARAAAWFAENGFLADALNHNMQAGSTSILGDSIRTAPIVVRSMSHPHRMRQMADALAELGPANDPKTLTLAAWLYAMLCNRDAAKRSVDRASRSPNMTLDLKAQHDIILASLAINYDDVEEADRLIGGLDRSQSMNGFVHQAYLAVSIGRDVALNRCSVVRQRMRIESICRDETLNDEMSMVVRSLLLSTYLRHGHMDEVIMYGRRLIRRGISAHGPRSIIANMCAAFTSAAEYQLNHIKAAEDLLDGRLDSYRLGTSQHVICAQTTHAALLRLRHGPEVADLFLVKQALHAETQGMTRFAAYVRAARVRCQLDLGWIGKAVNLQRELADQASQVRNRPGYLRDIEILAAIAQARVCLALHKFAQSSEAAECAYAMASEEGLPALSATALFLRGLACTRDNEAAAFLSHGVEVCHEHGLVRTALDSGVEWPRHAARLQGMLNPTVWLWFAAEVLGQASADADGCDSATKPDGASGLTSREAEIVELLGSAMSNKEIALALGVSPETVKWNLKNIFSKLQISDRRQVVAKARLEPGDRMPVGTPAHVFPVA